MICWNPEKWQRCPNWRRKSNRNALSSSGFSLQTTKNGKGQMSVELTGHVSLKAQSVVPMEFYSTEGDDAEAAAANAATAAAANGGE